MVVPTDTFLAGGAMPGATQATSQDTTEPLLIELAGRREWPVIIWLSLLVGTWGIAGGRAALSFDNNLPLWFDLGFLFVWALVLAFEIGVLAWYLIGREEIEVSDDHLVLRRITGPSRRQDQFQRDRIKRIRTTPFPRPLVRLYRMTYGWGDYIGTYGPSGGTVLFDHGRRTYRFGQKLSEDEAMGLATRVADRIGSRGRGHQSGSDIVRRNRARVR